MPVRQAPWPWTPSGLLLAAGVTLPGQNLGLQVGLHGRVLPPQPADLLHVFGRLLELPLQALEVGFQRPDTLLRGLLLPHTLPGRRSPPRLPTCRGRGRLGPPG